VAGVVVFARYERGLQASSIPDPYRHVPNAQTVASRVDCDPVIEGFCSRWIVLSPAGVTQPQLVQEAAGIALRSLHWRRDPAPSSSYGLGVWYDGPSQTYDGGYIGAAATELTYWLQQGSNPDGDPDKAILHAMKATPNGVVVQILKTNTAEGCTPTEC
jgi:hypothetical protein